MFYFCCFGICALHGHPVLTPPTGMLCVCVQPYRHACISTYVSLCMLVCVCVCVCRGESLCVRKSSSKFMCISLMHMTTPPKCGKKQTAIKKKQVTIQLQWDSWMVPCLKWTTEPFHGTQRHLVTFTVWWFTLKSLPWVCSVKVVFPLQLVIVGLLYSWVQM